MDAFPNALALSLKPTVQWFMGLALSDAQVAKAVAEKSPRKAMKWQSLQWPLDWKTGPVMSGKLPSVLYPNSPIRAMKWLQ